MLTTTRTWRSLSWLLFAVVSVACTDTVVRGGDDDGDGDDVAVSVEQHVGPFGVTGVDPGFEAATAGQSSALIDFDGDGFDELAEHTFTPIADEHYAALGVTLVGLDARSVGAEPWAHSPPIGAWATGFDATPAPYSFVFDAPVASFGLFANDVEAPVAVTVHLDGGAIEEFTLPSKDSSDNVAFHGFTTAVDAIVQIDFASVDYHIIDDVRFGRVDSRPVE